MSNLERYTTEQSQFIAPDHLHQLSCTGIELLEAARFESDQRDSRRQQPEFDITQDFRSGLVDARFNDQETRAHWERRNPQNPVFYDKLVVNIVNNSLVIALSSRRDTRAWSEEHNTSIEVADGNYNTSVQINANGGELYERNTIRARHNVMPLEGEILDAFNERLYHSISLLGSYDAVDLRKTS